MSTEINLNALKDPLFYLLIIPAVISIILFLTYYNLYYNLYHQCLNNRKWTIELIVRDDYREFHSTEIQCDSFRMHGLTSTTVYIDGVGTKIFGNSIIPNTNKYFKPTNDIPNNESKDVIIVNGERIL